MMHGEKTRSTGWIPAMSVSNPAAAAAAESSSGRIRAENKTPTKVQKKTPIKMTTSWVHECIYPWNGEVRHQLVKGPRLLRLLLIVQRDLLAELPGVRATSSRGSGHRAGRSVTTLATRVEGGGGKTMNIKKVVEGAAESYCSKSPSERCRESIGSFKKHTFPVGGSSFVCDRKPS